MLQRHMKAIVSLHNSEFSEASILPILEFFQIPKILQMNTCTFSINSVAHCLRLIVPYILLLNVQMGVPVDHFDNLCTLCKETNYSGVPGNLFSCLLCPSKPLNCVLPNPISLSWKTLVIFSHVGAASWFPLIWISPKVPS